jgi:hypothetical protein
MREFFRVGKGMALVRVRALPNHAGYEAWIPGVSRLAAYGDTVEEAVDAATGA